jgi:RecJ-like exonuclease
MIRRFFSFVLIAAVITSCGNAGKKDAAAKTEGIENGAKVEFAALVENPDNYVGKNITVEGKVVHVCTESGKKLFIVGANPDITLYIAAGENMPKFPMELLGTTVSVEGVITKVGGAPKEAAMEPMKMAEGMKMAGGDSCVTEKALASQASLSNIIMEYKSHVVK